MIPTFSTPTLQEERVQPSYTKAHLPYIFNFNDKIAKILKKKEYWLYIQTIWNIKAQDEIIKGKNWSAIT